MSPPAEPSPATVPGSARRIAQLALPALVVLAAEPLYVLVDTAVVGHLGRIPLAAAAVSEGVQASWLALGIGAGLVVLVQIVADPLARALASDPGAAEAAAAWL